MCELTNESAKVVLSIVNLHGNYKKNIQEPSSLHDKSLNTAIDVNSETDLSMQQKRLCNGKKIH